MTDFKQTTTYEDISGVYFYYTMAKTPDYGYNPKKIPVKDLPKAGYRYKVDVCLSKEQATAFSAAHPTKKVSKIENDDFLKAYKVDTVPFPNQALQYVITFKQKVYTAKGDEMPESLRPTVQMFVNGEQQDVTQTVNVGNGSQGAIRFSVWQRAADADPTISFYTMLVTNLVPYEEKEKPVRVDPRSFGNASF